MPGDRRGTQRGTGRHLDTKTGPVAGFAGVALTLNATLGRPLLTAKLDAPWECIAHASLDVAVGGLLVAAVAALVGFIAPSSKTTSRARTSVSLPTGQR